MNKIPPLTVKCKRCRKPRVMISFWAGVQRLKLCHECREYNRQYLSVRRSKSLLA